MSNVRFPLRKLSLISVLFLFGGCATTQSPVNVRLTKESASQVKTVLVHLASNSEQTYSVTTSVDTSAAHMNTQSSGNPLADLLGHMIAEGIIQSAGSNSQKNKDPLLEFTKDVKFSEPFSKEFQKGIGASDWLHVRNFSQSETPLSTEAQQEFRKSSGDASVLFANARYYFSGDYRRVYVATDVEMWLDEKSNQPLYRGTYLYCSDPVGEDGESMENYLQAWSNNGNERLRKTLNQGNEEIRQMLSVGPLAHLSEVSTTHQSKEIQLNGCTNAIIKGDVIAMNNKRSIILSDMGNYYSAPSNESFK